MAVDERAPLFPGEPVELFAGIIRLLAPNASLMTGPGTNTYIIGAQDLVVIDPGPDDPGHLDRIVALVGDCLRYVLVTHSHRDHAPGARPLANATGALLLGFDERPTYRPDGKLGEGDSIVTDRWRLEALHTPGHASDHLCFVAKAVGGDGPRLIFSGDHIMQGSTVVIGPPDGDMGEYFASLRRVRDLEPPIEVIAPGHGHLIDDPKGAIERYLTTRAKREAAILQAVRAGARCTAEIVKAVYPIDLDERLVRHAGRSVWAHLRKLHAEAKVSTSDPDDPDSEWTPATN